MGPETACAQPPWDCLHLLGCKNVEVVAAAIHQQIPADGRAWRPHLLGMVYLALGAVEKDLAG